MQKSAHLKERLVHRRNRLGLTQADLADKSGVSLRSISNYEGGELPTIEQLYKLAAALGTSAGWLLGEEEARPGVLRDEAIKLTDPESVRLALRSLKGQVKAVADQIEFYERQICGPQPSSSASSEAEKLVERAGQLYDEKHPKSD